MRRGRSGPMATPETYLRRRPFQLLQLLVEALHLLSKTLYLSAAPDQVDPELSDRSKSERQFQEHRYISLKYIKQRRQSDLSPYHSQKHSPTSAAKFRVTRTRLPRAKSSTGDKRVSCTFLLNHISVVVRTSSS